MKRNSVVIIRGGTLEVGIITRFYFNVDRVDAQNRYDQEFADSVHKRFMDGQVVEFVDELSLVGWEQYLGVKAII